MSCKACRHRERLVAARLPYTRYEADGEPVMAEPFDPSNLVDLGALEAVLAYEEHLQENLAAGRGLLLWGRSGGGKTRLAAQIGLAAALAGVTVRFASMQGILNQVKATFGSKRDDAVASGDTIWAGYRDCELLILDDPGVERGSSWAEAQAYDLLDTRITKRLPLIVTANYSPRELAAELAPSSATSGQRIASRLIGLCLPVEVQVHRDYREVLAERALAANLRQRATL